MQNNNAFYSRAFTAITIAALVFALNVSGALAGFWRTIDGTTSNGVTNPLDFLYGIGWDGSNTGVNGYGYGFGYGTFDAGYADGTTSSSTTTSSGGGGGGYSSSTVSGTIPTTPSTDTTTTTDSTGNTDSTNTGSTSTGSTSGSTNSSSTFEKRTYASEPKLSTCGVSIVNFNDIAGHTFEQHIKNLEAISGLNGNGNGTNFSIYTEESKSFQPNRAATRSEYVKMILRALCIDYSDMNSFLDDFSDGAVDPWQAKVVNKAADLGWITTTNATFRVNDTISRVEALKIVMKAGVLTPLMTPSTSSFADVAVGSWESKYTEAAVGYGVIAPNANYRPMDAILRGESTKLIMNTLH